MDKFEFDGQELIFVAGLDLGEMYEWDELEVYYIASQRKFFWISGSGCSCDSLWDDVSSLSYFENGNRKDAVNAIRSHVSGRSVGWEAKAATEAVMKVMAFRIP